MYLKRARNKLIRFAHDSKATICTQIGHRLKQVENHSGILNKILIQKESYSLYENHLEKSFYNTPEKISLHHPARHLYILEDIWITGSEGHIFFKPDTLFSICPSMSGVAQRKIRRPIKSLSDTIHEPVFILYGRGPDNRFHYLIEHLPRLVASLETIKKVGCEKILITPGQYSWQSSYLDKLGFPASSVQEGSVGSVYCKKAYFVPLLSEGIHTKICSNQYYSEIRRYFTPNQKIISKGFPIFISRNDAASRRLINEDSLYAIAAKYFSGIKRVMMSTLSLDEQIDIFQQAPVIIGVHGQPFRNVLFCRKSLVIQLMPGLKKDTSNEYNIWGRNINYLGIMNENQCIALYNEQRHSGGDNWTYPEDKFKRDIKQLVTLLRD